MARNKLTDTFVKSAKPGKHGDGDGLWLHVSPAGNRSWVFIFIRGGKRREMGLGAYGRGTGQVSLAGARAKADAIREILGRGADPFLDLPERAAKRKVATFGECADDLIESLRPGWKNQKHADQWVMTLKEYAKPLRKLSVEQVSVDDVVRCLKPIWLEKPETASRLRGRVEKVLDYAKARGLRTGENPAAWKGNLDHLLPSQANIQTTHHSALEYKAIRPFWKTLSEAEGFGAMALQFTILTASRTSEVLNATWTEFDIEAALWVIPAERMKMKRQHVVPLSRVALDIIVAAEKVRISDFIFAGAKKEKPLSNMSMTQTMRRIGFGDYTVHGFRSTFRDWAADETSFQREIIEEALAHKVGSDVELSYRRGQAVDRRRVLMEAWAQYVTEMPAGVVRLHA